MELTSAAIPSTRSSWHNWFATASRLSKKYVSALERLNNQGDELRSELNRICRQYNSCIQFTGLGSILGLHTTNLEIHSVRDLVHCDDRKLELIFLDLLERGYYIARRGFIALMLSLEQEQLDGFVEAFSKVIITRSELLN
jgi:glutamate-1-semialdehyde 2,1-aminomutase